MLIKTFLTLVNHYNCSFFRNLNSPKLNTTYTSHLIFFGPILVPKALFASLSRRRLREAKRAMRTRMFHYSSRWTAAPNESFCRLQSNAVSLFQTNHVVHWNAPEFSILRDVHSKTLLSRRQRKSWVSRSTGKSRSAFAIKLGSYLHLNNKPLVHSRIIKVSVKLACYNAKDSNSGKKLKSSAFPCWWSTE